MWHFLNMQSLLPLFDIQGPNTCRGFLYVGYLEKHDVPLLSTGYLKKYVPNTRLERCNSCLVRG